MSAITEVTAASTRPVKKPRVHGVYRHACPNCGGPITDLRLLYKAPCENCLPQDKFNAIVSKLGTSVDPLDLFKEYQRFLLVEGGIKRIVEEEEELKRFEEFFAKATGGFKMWSAQRTWAKRLLKKESFCIIAPTGTGKTVFSLISALYKAQSAKSKGRKVYLAFPTTPLLLQAWRKLLKFSENLGIKVCTTENWGDDCLKVLCIHGKLNKKEKELYLEKLKSGDFDILLTTSAYMHRHGDEMPKGVYDLVIMDDVDAVLRSGRTVRKLLNLMGLRDEVIDRGLEVVKLRAKLSSLPSEEAEKTRVQLEQLERTIEEARKAIGDAVLVVNSATGRPRGLYPKLFRVFLNFEAGAKPEAIRNIVDAYTVPPDGKLEEVVVELAEKLKDGFLVFVPVDKGIEYAEYLAGKLRERGLRVEAFHSRKQSELIEKFASGELNALVGVATYYGVMVRGIDLPERVKYVIFAGVPRHKFSTRVEAVSPLELLRMLIIVREVSEGEEKENIDVLIGRIARRLRSMSQGALVVVREKFINVLQGKAEEETPLLRDLLKAYEIVREKLSKRDVLSKLSKLGDVALISENGEIFILIPDVATYIQASGRCSRLYPGGITKGLSIIVVDDERLLNGLVKRLRWTFEGFRAFRLEDLNLGDLIKEISTERDLVRKIMSGEVQAEKPVELVKTALLVVESPNKARTIANFFGKPSIRVLGEGLRAYEVTIGNYILNIVASGGHIYDLVVDTTVPEAQGKNHLYGVLVDEVNGEYVPIYTDIKKCAKGHQFTDEVPTCPRCGSPVTRKLHVIDSLRKLASEVDVVLIGTDPDAEGEKIAWDLKVLLEPFAKRVLRVEFHEVTRRAIMGAILNPRDFNEKLVEAQIVRRIEDRWLGFSLSGMVQKYAWPVYCIKYLCGKRVENPKECLRPNRNLSAGRVQTPVLEYIVEENKRARDPAYSNYVVRIELERGRERRELQVSVSYEDAKKLGLLDYRDRLIKLNKKGKNAKQVLALAEVRVLEERVEEIPPPPPFTTDALLEDASRRLGFSTTKTMELAQDLFEMGFITYHRTDSTRVSDVGIEVAKSYLEEEYGREKLPEIFSPRTWGVGGAHEAIRPTRPIDADHLAELIREGAIVVAGKVTKDHLRLYDLIFRRFIASQVKPARVLKQKLLVELQVNDSKVNVEKEVIVDVYEKGYLEFYNNVQVELEKFGGEGSKLTGYIVDVSRRKYPLPRFHDVVKWMKLNGIGRPSTYAKIIQTLIDRRYVEVSKTRKALVVQRRGVEVFQFLKELFGDLVSVKTTSNLEKVMDMVERGEVYYQDVLTKLYREVVESVIGREREVAEYVKKQLNTLVESVERGEITLPSECVELIGGQELERL